MKSKTDRKLGEILADWLSEDRELGRSIDEIRGWMKQVSQLGIPHFGETATRLSLVKERLVEHFQREDELVEELGRRHSEASPEVVAIGHQSARDHRLLMARIDDLCRRLNELRPPFETWQAAMRDVEDFLEDLEQHEEQESRSVGVQIPSREH